MAHIPWDLGRVPCCASARPCAASRQGLSRRLPRQRDRFGGAAQRALENGFRDLGYAPGQRILLEYRFSELSAERLREFASEFVHMPVDLILADTNSAVAAAKQATTLIPIVMIVGTGVVHAGLIQSLPRLGGNVTGLTADSAPETILAKQVATLQECVPNLRKLGVLWNPNAPGYRIYFDILEAQASQLHVEVQSLEVTSPDTVGAAFQAAKKQPKRDDRFCGHSHVWS